MIIYDDDDEEEEIRRDKRVTFFNVITSTTLTLSIS
jgi:hypothetical protein